jgi:ABC-2 type transport system permease protein
MITQWFVLYRKEMIEMWRNYKWLWVPLVFILFGASQPITTYYMPDILKATGGLPEGAILQIPMPSGAEMIASTLSQYGTIGVLILVLAFMGAISSERVSGVIHMVMMKPVPHRSYVSSKWAAMATLTGVSFIAGMLAAWYYTMLLLGDVSFDRFALSLLLYGLWLAFIISITLILSVLLKSSGSTAFLTIGIVFILSITSSFLGKWMRWSPANLSEHANSVLLQGKVSAQFPLCLGATIFLIAILIEGAVYLFRSKQASL